MGKYNQFYRNNKQTPKLSRQTIHNQNNKTKRLNNANPKIIKNIQNTNGTAVINQQDVLSRQNNIVEQKTCDDVSTVSIPFDGDTNFNNNSITHEHDSMSISTLTFCDKMSTTLNEINIDAATKQKQISMALLTLFFSGDFSKTGLSKITEFTQIFSDVKIPKSFVNLLNQLDKNPINYEKKWFCATCFVYVRLHHQYQRRCSRCDS